MEEWIRRRLSHFLETHERAFRTELILVPVLVLSIKFLGEAVSHNGWPVQLAVIILGSLFSYLVCSSVAIAIGDGAWRWLAFRLNPLNPYCGLFVQKIGAKGRDWAISRIYFDKKRAKFIYRGIAYDEQKPHNPAAAWEEIVENHEIVNGDMAMFFSGKSVIGKDLPSINIEELTNIVFTTIYFTGSNRFVGGGFDCTIDGKYRSDFPIAAYRVDEKYIESHGISKDLLQKGLFISSKDRRAIFEFEPAGYALPAEREGSDSQRRIAPTEARKRSVFSRLLRRT